MADDHEEGGHILDFLDEVLEKKGLSITDEEGVETAEDLIQRWIVAEEEKRISPVYYELLSVYSLVRLYNEMVDEYHSEYNSIKQDDFSDVSFDDAHFTKNELADKWSRIEAADKIVLFFTLAHEKIEQLSLDVFEESIIDDEFKDSTGTTNCIQSISQPQREQLLLRSGTIGSGLHSKMKDTREIRNSLLHDLTVRYRGNTERDVDKEGSRAIEAINELYGMTSEYEMFSGMISTDEF